MKGQIRNISLQLCTVLNEFDRIATMRRENREKISAFSKGSDSVEKKREKKTQDEPRTHECRGRISPPIILAAMDSSGVTSLEYIRMALSGGPFMET